jgi:hypothetical protein
VPTVTWNGSRPWQPSAGDDPVKVGLVAATGQAYAGEWPQVGDQLWRDGTFLVVTKNRNTEADRGPVFSMANLVQNRC